MKPARYALDISDIRFQKGASKEVSENPQIGSVTLRGQDVDLGTVSITGRAENVGEGILLQANAVGTITLTCSRCLDKFKHPLTLNLNEYFAFEDSEAEHLIEDNHIDLGLVIIESLALNLDIKILCKEDCAGICPSCGLNLNKGPCECKEQVINVRWQKLQELKKRMKS